MLTNVVLLNTVVKAKDLGRVGTSKYIWTFCEDCKEQRWVILSKNKPKSTLCKSCANRRWIPGRIREAHNAWKGGKSKTTNGYISILLSSEDLYRSMANCTGHVMEHRLVMAKHLGRCLSDIEVVHHLNGIKDDNGIKNLILTTNKEHRQIIPNFKDEIRKLEEVIRNQAIRIRRLELKVGGI